MKAVLTLFFVAVAVASSFDPKTCVFTNDKGEKFDYSALSKTYFPFSFKRLQSQRQLCSCFAHFSLFRFYLFFKIIYYFSLSVFPSTFLLSFVLPLHLQQLSISHSDLEYTSDARYHLRLCGPAPSCKAISSTASVCQETVSKDIFDLGEYPTQAVNELGLFLLISLSIYLSIHLLF